MRVLVFGKTGQVARELARQCPKDITVKFLSRKEADLSKPEECAQAIKEHAVDAVINAAAWTAVDKAEVEEGAATVINGDAPGSMARACADKDIPFLHISTDYVFRGTGSVPFCPNHPTAPLGAYGRSKLAGEEAIRASGVRHIILRTSWVVSAHGTNFLKTMLRLGAKHGSLKVVDDQVGGPTPAAAIADALFVATIAMVGRHSGGTYHFSGTPNVSWAEFARAIMELSGHPCRVEGIPASDYPTATKRPYNSRLDCNSLLDDLCIPRPDWQAYLPHIIKDIGIN